MHKHTPTLLMHTSLTPHIHNYIQISRPRSPRNYQNLSWFCRRQTRSLWLHARDYILLLRIHPGEKCESDSRIEIPLWLHAHLAALATRALAWFSSLYICYKRRYGWLAQQNNASSQQQKETYICYHVLFMVTMA